MTAITLTGGHVLTPHGDLEKRDIHIANGRFVDAPAVSGMDLDCRGLRVLPGLVDVHGDAFETELFPRPGVRMPFPIAFGSIDRQLLSSGITTAFHGLSVTWEPGARSLREARRFMNDLGSIHDKLAADHRVQLRWEIFAHDAISDVAAWLDAELTPAIAFNDHMTSSIEAVNSGNRNKLEKWAQRVGVHLDEYVAAMSAAEARKSDVPSKVREVAGMARTAGAVMLAHDETTTQQREAHRELGMRVCEFPLSADVAADAVQNGEHVVMGGPNVILGGSHKGFMSAEDAIREGHCTVLASDYYFPSLFHAAKRLVERGVLPFSSAWNLVSANPAQAMGLADRGAIAPGRRADAVVVDCSDTWGIAFSISSGSVFRFGS